MILKAENCSRDFLIAVCIVACASGYSKNKGQIPIRYSLSQFTNAQEAIKVIMNIL